MVLIEPLRMLFKGELTKKIIKHTHETVDNSNVVPQEKIKYIERGIIRKKYLGIAFDAKKENFVLIGETLSEKIRELDLLLKKNIITEDEYKIAVKEIGAKHLNISL